MGSRCQSAADQGTFAGHPPARGRSQHFIPDWRARTIEHQPPLSTESTTSPLRVLLVDRTARNVHLLEAILGPHGFAVSAASDGREALRQIRQDCPDLVLLDALLEHPSILEIVRDLRADQHFQSLPIVLIGGSDQERREGLEAGADELLSKPFNPVDVLARVRSQTRIAQSEEKLRAQEAQLAEWDRSLDARVQERLGNTERVARLKSFLSPQVAQMIVDSGDEQVLATHRRQIAVLFCDLRGFTAFAETAEPEELMSVLRAYHRAAGPLITEYEGTLGHFAGDGLMVYFNDPFPCDDPTGKAVRLAVTLRERMRELEVSWLRQGWELGFGVGIAFGYATLGVIGFEGRYDYGVIGTVVNLASRLCGEAQSGQILLSQRAYTLVEDLIHAEELPPMSLKGFSRPVLAYALLAIRDGIAPAS